MDKSLIRREDLKRNFLKEIIMRLDFQGVFQPEMERILVKVKSYLKNELFTRYDTQIRNKIMSGENIPDVTSEVTHIFISESRGYTIEMSTSYIILTVSTQGYVSFEEYSEIFCEIARIYKDNIDFFTVKRFGLRKINFCFVKEKNCITKYFSNVYYNCEEPISEFTTQRSNRSDKLYDGKYNINMGYVVEQGKIGDDDVYKIVLDSDIYLSNQKDIEDAVFNEVGLEAINEKLFEIYINIITDDFLNYLTSDEKNLSDEILGVDDNE